MNDNFILHILVLSLGQFENNLFRLSICQKLDRFRDVQSALYNHHTESSLISHDPIRSRLIDSKNSLRLVKLLLPMHWDRIQARSTDLSPNSVFCYFTIVSCPQIATYIKVNIFHFRLSVRRISVLRFACNLEDTY